MSLEIQFKLKSNQKYLQFLRENSYWYKYLNRDTEYFKEFEDNVKTTYKLRPVDKIEKAIDTVDMIQTLINSLK